MRISMCVLVPKNEKTDLQDRQSCISVMNE